MKSYKVFDPARETVAVCGHRGAPALAKENTLEGFAAARDHGATWLEFDVRPTADDHFVVHHDPVTTEGHHIGTTPVGALPDYIPTLNQVMETFGDLVLDVELKTDDCDRSTDTYVALAGAALEQLVAIHGDTGVLVTSFDAAVLRGFAQQNPGVATGFLYYLADADFSDEARERSNDHAVAHAIEIGHQAIVPHHKLVTSGLVASAHANGLHVATWTVNSAADVQRCAEAGVDVIIGDDPRVIAEALASLS